MRQHRIDSAVESDWGGIERMAKREKPKALGGGGTGLGLLWGAYSIVTTAKGIPEDAGWFVRMIADPPIYLPWLVAAIGLVVIIWAFFWPSNDSGRNVSGISTGGGTRPRLSSKIIPAGTAI